MRIGNNKSKQKKITKELPKITDCYLISDTGNWKEHLVHQYNNEKHFLIYYHETLKILQLEENYEKIHILEYFERNWKIEEINKQREMNKQLKKYKKKNDIKYKILANEYEKYYDTFIKSYKSQYNYYNNLPLKNKLRLFTRQYVKKKKYDQEKNCFKSKKN